MSRGFPLEDSLLAFWVPFVAADAGNFAGGGLSSILMVEDHYSFAPILIGASIVPLIATALLLILIRNGPATERSLLRRI